MPTTRSRRTRNLTTLTPAAEAYLADDQTMVVEDTFTLWCYRTGMPGMDGDPKPKELWEKHKDEFLPDFIQKNPGKRPIAWWHWSAPRWADQGSGFWYEGTLQEPRERISGKGELRKGYVPFLQYGVQQHWQPENLDPNDPLIFESQTSYLLRHNLLTEMEKKYIEKHQELLEPEKVNIEKE